LQNFEILVVDDTKLLETLGKIESHISEEFIQGTISSSRFRKGVTSKEGRIIGTMFPPTWTDPAKVDEAVRRDFVLNRTIRGSPMLLIVIYDPKKRAPASRVMCWAL